MANMKLEKISSEILQNKPQSHLRSERSFLYSKLHPENLI